MRLSDTGFSIADLLRARGERDEGESVLEAVGHAMELARAAEGLVTSALERLAAESGGQMVGLEYAVKSEDSAVRKVTGMLRRRSVRSVQEGVQKLHDLLRYTMTFEPEDYSAAVENALAGLRQQGFEFKLSDVENSWRDRAEYHGINMNMRTPDGQWVEIQFHTPESWETKEKLLHKLYEEYRAEGTLPYRRKELKDEMIRITGKLKLPPGVDDLGVRVRGKA
jgi:hypothetical protein